VKFVIKVFVIMPACRMSLVMSQQLQTQ